MAFNTSSDRVTAHSSVLPSTMKLIVTGSNGRLGRRVVIAALKAGHTVVGVDNRANESVDLALSGPNFTFREADLCEYGNAVQVLQGSEAVIHLAALPTPQDYIAITHNTNVVISWNVLRAAAELGITRVAQASSVNVVTLVWSQGPKLHYLPLDEDHPCEPDEPYGLSKVICEMQAATLVRRYTFMRIASIRLSWSLPDPSHAKGSDPERRKNDLWGYIQEDSAADAFLRAVCSEGAKWSGHEAFFIAAPEPADDRDAEMLWKEYWRMVPIKEGKTLSKGFFDCSKAERLLGWVHTTPVEA